MDPRICGAPSTLVTVWFDGDCPLCAREIAIMRRLDRNGAVNFVDLAGAQPGSFPDSLDRCALLNRLHAQEQGAPVVSGAEAFAAMWRAIPLLRPLGRLARRRAVLWGLERLYLAFLKVRPALQAVARRGRPRPEVRRPEVRRPEVRGQRHGD